MWRLFTGNFGDRIEAMKSAATGAKQSPGSFEMRPRLGQYIIFDASKASGLSADGLLLTRPIQPLPTDTTKGIFIYSTLYGHIVVGPTSDETTIRENATPDPAVRETLMAHAYQVCGDYGWVIDG